MIHYRHSLVSLTVLAALTGCGGSSSPQHAGGAQDVYRAPTDTAPMAARDGDAGDANPSAANDAPAQMGPADQDASPSPSPPQRLNRTRQAETAKRAVSHRPAPPAPPVQQPLGLTGTRAVGPVEKPSGDEFTDYGINKAVDASKDKLSTFSVDVDTASYAIARSYLRRNTLPSPQSVRAEEFVNYFSYDYAAPKRKPFAMYVEGAPSPYTPRTHLVRVGLKARTPRKRKPVHLVFLVDTSGSMSSPNKLGLAQESLRTLTNHLKDNDTVALCTYAGSTRVVLTPTGIDNRKRILQAIDGLRSGGGTAMGSGMENAYRLASQTAVAGHVNRVIVLSDGDANIGRTTQNAILKSVEQYRKDKNITLSTVGFGNGNYKDTLMEQLANKGDGNYSYIDSRHEAEKVFGEQLDGLLEVVAKDTKVQVEFDPNKVKTYRLIGYENRKVADRDFRNDAVDAGEVGSGHQVTALYEVSLKPGQRLNDAVLVRIRYKAPDGTNVREMQKSLASRHVHDNFSKTSRSYKLAVAVMGFAEVLRKSPYARNWSLNSIAAIAKNARSGSREENELVSLIEIAIRKQPAHPSPSVVVAK